MKNLIAFFENERQAEEQQANAKGKSLSEKPQQAQQQELAELEKVLANMTNEEQKEIFQTIDIPKDVDVKDAIFRTLKHFNDPDSGMTVLLSFLPSFLTL
jgi:5-formyltetrahydrofolate cyclo-ligase